MSTQDQTTRDQGTGVDGRLQTDRIFETAQRMPEISKFVEAIMAAGLQNDLQTIDFKTLFAPRNEAVSGKLAADIVAKHIVMGRQMEADLRTANELRTLNGQSVKVAFEPDGARFGGAKIVRRDVACHNGSIHVIDAIAS